MAARQHLRWKARMEVAMLASNHTIKWIENLADQERLIRAGEKNSLDICSTKDEALITGTNAFLRTLYYHFEFLVRLFNTRVDHSALQLQLKREGDHFDGFALKRNGIKLFANGSQPGTVHFSCERVEASGAAVTTGVQFSGSIEARFEPFHEVQWFFLDAPVRAEQVARHYLTEFLQVSTVERSH